MNEDDYTSPSYTAYTQDTRRFTWMHLIFAFLLGVMLAAGLGTLIVSLERDAEARQMGADTAAVLQEVPA